MVDFDPNPDVERDYEEYELTKEERDSLRSIQKIADAGYTDLSLLRSHINYLEKMIAHVQDVLRNEERMGYQNDTLKHDFQKLRGLCSRLDAEFGRLDTSF